MLNFQYYNPVRIVFGRDTIAQLADLVPPDASVMVVYGGGSIKRNGVYQQVVSALSAHRMTEFSGIEANPRYETCMQAVAQGRREGAGFLLGVGGGSVLDATKFIAAAIPYQGADPWDMVIGKASVNGALPLGCVLTLPATGSEMNINAVISRESTRQKVPFKSEHLFPQFSILDPATSFSLPMRQLANGVVDTFVHVCEQYLTYEVDAPLQNRQAEAILSTLIEEAPKLQSAPNSYEVRANLMWCATQALNYNLACGVPTDWATHAIGHELTALFGLDHARALAIVLPALLRHQKTQKADMLFRYGQRVWGQSGRDREAVIDEALERTIDFFHSLEVPTRLGDYQIRPQDCREIVSRIQQRPAKIGERQDIGAAEVAAILSLAE